jgi:hypothetical protein
MVNAQVAGGSCVAGMAGGTYGRTHRPPGVTTRGISDLWIGLGAGGIKPHLLLYVEVVPIWRGPYSSPSTTHKLPFLADTGPYYRVGSRRW